jgi:hypothetical protein
MGVFKRFQLIDAWNSLKDFALTVYPGRSMSIMKQIPVIIAFAAVAGILLLYLPSPRLPIEKSELSPAGAIIVVR